MCLADGFTVVELSTGVADLPSYLRNMIALHDPNAIPLTVYQGESSPLASGCLVASCDR